MWVGTLLAVLAAVVLEAQRPIESAYDEDRRIRLRGTVGRVEWVNPRAYIFIAAPEAGGTQLWAVDIGAPLELERAGWKRSSLAIGDLVVIDANPASGHALRARARTVVLERTGRRIFSPSPKPPAVAAQGPIPRWPDGQVRLGAPPGRKGYWGTASANGLVDSSAGAITMSGAGLLADLSDADRVAPFQPWAKAVYLYRQRTRLADDPLARCLPPGGPRQFQMPNGFQFVEQRDLGRILVLLGGGNRNWRVIYTDGRPLGVPAEAVPSYYGYSVGRWEKDTLVVDSVGFNERFWMSNGGLPHTEALHLIERFTRTSLGTLRYEVTVDDPRTYRRRWSGGWTVQWVPDEEIQEYFCEENVESTFGEQP